MSNSRRKSGRRKQKKRNTSLFVTFLCTLTIVVIIGLSTLLAGSLLSGRKYGNTDEYSHIRITVESIPEDATEEEVVAATSQAVEEIKQENSKYADQIEDEAYLIANNIYVKESAHADDGTGLNEVSITVAGDILFDDEYAVMSTLKANGGNISSGIDSELLNIMKASDIFMVNNEFPYTYGGSPTEDKQYTFRADPDTVNYLHDMDVDLVSLANNHAYDYGQQAFLDTLDTLNGAGIPYVGAGIDLSEAERPVYYIVNNLKIGFLSATQIERTDNPDTKGATDSSPGVFRCWNNKKLLEQISVTKENCDFLIVYIHWGTESNTEIDWAQQEQAPQMVNAGADLIIGDHPHVLQPITSISGVPVVYSLGNFWFNSKEIDTCLVQATISENGLDKLQFIPCIQKGCRTTALYGEEAARVIGNMRAMSPGISIDSDGYITF